MTRIAEMELAPPSNRYRCHLCDTQHVVLIYSPDTTERGLKVYVCQCCGLVQSLPRVDNVKKHEIKVSSGAAWGNVRYGKAFSVAAAIRLIEEKIALHEIKHCLDVGANRGAFIAELNCRLPAVEFTAIEPDYSVTAAMQGNEKLTLIHQRIEHTKLQDNYFELIHCSHTLEHVASPQDVLLKLRQALAEEGVLYLQVPNIDCINNADMVEEWFIDKHLYHFSIVTLKRLVKQCGFEILYCSNETDQLNITLLLRKMLAIESPLTESPSVRPDCENVAPCITKSEVKAIEKSIRRYHQVRTQNIDKLTTLAQKIEIMAKSENVVFWGAGRIFDSLVNLGGLNVKLLGGIVDRYLVKYTNQVHGCLLMSPEKLVALNADVIIVASRQYFSQIKQEAQHLLAKESPTTAADVKILQWSHFF